MSYNLINKSCFRANAKKLWIRKRNSKLNIGLKLKIDYADYKKKIYRWS